MAADPVVYCLERVTDHFQFERFCTDFLVAQGYQGIEPLGGTKDKGRDALYKAYTPDGVRSVVCAYSIRKDWMDKLIEDCQSIKKNAHPCDQVTFVCTAVFTPAERDKAKDLVHQKFDWDLELFGLERLRPHVSEGLRANHPAIFTPEFFSKTPLQERDCLVIDYTNHPEDKFLATWLAQRLSLSGYRVWCYPLSPVAGESLGGTIEKLIECNAYRYLCVFSAESANDPDLNARCTLAARQEARILIPLLAKGYNPDRVDAKVKALVPIDLRSELSSGLSLLLKTLTASNCPKCLDESQSRLFLPFASEKVIRNEPETLYSNRFRVENVPEAIYRFECSTVPPQEVIDQAHSSWVFRRTGECSFVAFPGPSQDVALSLSIKPAGGVAWRYYDEIDNIPSKDLFVDLLRRTINFDLRKRGLAYCFHSKAVYFPPGVLHNNWLPYITVDGKKRRVKVTGLKKFKRTPQEVYYRYYLIPSFAPIIDENGRIYLIVKPRVRITDETGKLLNSGTSINARRKHLCKAWWNKEWFARTLAIVAYLRCEEGKGIGSDLKNPITIAEFPESWVVPNSINEKCQSDFKPPTISEVLDAIEVSDGEGEDSE